MSDIIVEIRELLAEMDADPSPVFGSQGAPIRGCAEAYIRHLLGELDVANEKIADLQRTADVVNDLVKRSTASMKVENERLHSVMENLHTDSVLWIEGAQRQAHIIGRLVDMLTRVTEIVTDVMDCVGCGRDIDPTLMSAEMKRIDSALEDLGLTWADGIEETDE